LVSPFFPRLLLADTTSLASEVDDENERFRYDLRVSSFHHLLWDLRALDLKDHVASGA
jgi:hypothetical protein